MHKLTKKQERESQILKSDKCSSLERSFFMCYCGKTYDSYPSLYLHSKKLHDKVVSKKQLKNTTFKWSGSIKNKYYELVQQVSGQCHQQVSCENIFFTKNSIQKQKSVNQNKREQVWKDFNKKETEYYGIQTEIEKVFSQYFQTTAGSANGKDVAIGQNYMEFILQNYESFQKNNYLGQFGSNRCLELIPLLMNDYSMRLGKENEAKRFEQIKRQLERISKWMYDKGYCKYWAILQKNYQEEFGKNLNSQKKQFAA